MRLSLLALLFVVSGSVSSNIITTPGKPVVIGIDGSHAGKRVCYYQDQAYSLGAVLQVGDHYITCDRANDFETNGALKWIPLEQANQVKPSTQTPDPNVKTYSIK
ncbi:hypothetical protein GCM10007938_30780 [Vibrio zhanjiangensis]|uniref:DUF1496 domain-containing protein n=1 Tax=Vibrio zhanjiangensis TaxID=1046128 RepID=A0ABQ6F234_9VIBR|nr:DUF1496 domain-containing protein [Vibrio zhanjiangensis]GLT19296.1 hypothetical protein GCM10007938_30780 [Vibrio zhanjiangensis]